MVGELSPQSSLHVRGFRPIAQTGSRIRFSASGMFTHSVRGMFWCKQDEAICSRFRDIDFRVPTLEADCGATMRPIPELTSQVARHFCLVSNTVNGLTLAGLQPEIWANKFQRYSKGRCHK